MRFTFAIRKILALVAVLVLWTDSGVARPLPHGPQDQADHIAKIRSQVAGIKPGKLIQVRLMDKQKLRGQLGASDADGFTLQTQGRAAAERRVSFAEVKSVTTVSSKGVRATTWIIAGAVVAVFVIAVVVFLAEKHNE